MFSSIAPSPWDDLAESLTSYPHLHTRLAALSFVSQLSRTLEPWQALRLCSNITHLVLSPYTQLGAGYAAAAAAPQEIGDLVRLLVTRILLFGVLTCVRCALRLKYSGVCLWFVCCML